MPIRKLLSLKHGSAAVLDGPLYDIGDGPVTIPAGGTAYVTGEGDDTITMGEGSTVVLDTANIINPNGPAIVCTGNATIAFNNDVTLGTTRSKIAAISVGPPGTTVTLQGTGVLELIAGTDCAAIGTDKGSTVGNIVILSGTIIATGSANGAAIGAGKNGTCGDITISGGYLTVTGGSDGAAIGACKNGGCGNITITGGTIYAIGGARAPGIGGAANSSVGTITITTGVTLVNSTKGSGASVSIGGGGATVNIASGANAVQN